MKTEIITITADRMAYIWEMENAIKKQGFKRLGNVRLVFSFIRFKVVFKLKLVK